MKNIKSFDEYLTEEKSIEIKIKNISRHLAFDKDVIKYLNTTRSKREIGWRDLLTKKLRGDDVNYINYVTKNMVQNLNPKITGPTSVKFKNDDDDDDDQLELDNRLTDTESPDRLGDIEDRLKNIEDTLGIDPEDSDTVDTAQDKAEELGFDTIKDDEESESEEEE